MKKKITKIFLPVIVFLILPQFVFASDKILQKSDLTYLGAFRVPKGPLGGASGINAETLKNSDINQPLAFNPNHNSLIISSYAYDKQVVEISIPTAVKSTVLGALNTATVLQVPVDPTNGNWDNVEADGTTAGAGATGVSGGMPGGLLVYNGKLIGSAWLYYDASGGNGWRSHFTSSLNWTSEGAKFSGLYQVGKNIFSPGLANGGYVGGYMAIVPTEWQSILGGTVLTGQSKIPIISRSSLGPSIWSFDPGTFGNIVPTAATVLLSYPTGHYTLGGYTDQATPYSGGQSGVVFPKGSNSILFFGQHGLGVQFDSSGVPVANNVSCSGAGTSDIMEVQTNKWLKANSPNGYICGATAMNAQTIAGGDACCFDPENSLSTGDHSLPYVPGNGAGCYGPGTTSITQARTNAWLSANITGSQIWSCGTSNMGVKEISAGDACCYDKTPGGLNKGDKSYPYIYYIWRYNANDLAKIKNGTTNVLTGQPYQPWDLVPDVWAFDLPFAGNAKTLGGVAYDAVKQRLYVYQSNGDSYNGVGYPLIHVFEISSLSNAYSISDFIHLVADWLKTIISPDDLNSDGIVNARDLGIMMSKWK